jgi:glycolate oxidase FAD binding subunit
MSDTMPPRTIAPANIEEAVGVLAGAAARGEAVAFRGGGSELAFGYPPEAVDLWLDTRGLGRVVEYAPSDMVVEVEAGCTLAALQAHLAPHRQRLAIDPPAPDRATIGGLIATNAFGPRRARFGSLRDLIVGISLVRADGVRVRGGGKVVKNVAGFDLPKLAVGSLGSLGMIATATFRLHPMPEAMSLSCFPACDAATARKLVREMTARQLEPAAMLAVRADDGAPGSYDVYVLFEGFASGVTEQRDRLESIAHAFGRAAPLETDSHELARLDGNARLHGNLRLRLAAPPAVLDRLESDALVPLAEAFADLRIALYPSLGIAFAAATPDDPGAAATYVDRARSLLESFGGNLVVLEAPDGANIDVYGTLPESFGLMRELKNRFDPKRRFNPGRFIGHL